MNCLRLIAAVFCFCCVIQVRSQVVINEVMHYPSTSQGLIGIGTEYVELFNSSPCLTADISCFIIGFADDDGGIVNNRGAIVLPAGTTIPPYGHYVIGTSSSSANPASVDFKTNVNTGNYCTVGNFVLANGDGWVGLYDASGVVVDALYWTVSAGEASKITTDSDLDDNPCVPPLIAGCGGPVASLASPKQIYQTFPSRISYIGQYVNANTISRIPDGGTWTRAIAPSINDATVGNCNGGTCLVPVSIAFTATKTNPTCGNSNGSITMNVTSAGAVSYAWSANAATGNNATASGLAAGTYSLTMTQNGCIKDTTITLNSNSTLNVALTNSVNPTCAGGNGSITATLSGGTAPYVVTIDTGGTPFIINVPFAISQTLSNLPAGTINVNVADNAGCSASANTTLTAPTNCCVYSLNATTIQPSCGNSNGSIAITIANGSGTFTYTWSANTSTGNTATASALGAGTYSVSVTQNACSKDTTITLNSAGSLTISLTNPVNPTCAGNDGSITANLSGGTAPYVVTIDTGGTPFIINVPFAISQTLSNLPAGTINVNVADNAGCSASANTTLTAPTNCCTVSLSASLVQPSCGNSDGNITCTAANGSGNYTYTWGANAATGNSPNAVNIGAGIYTLTLTDNGFANCFIDTSFTLTNPNAPVINAANVTNETCTGTGDGSISINASGGTGALSYIWSANAATGNSSTAINLGAGNYSFTVTDINNCQVISSATVQSNICCTLQTALIQTATTCGNNNGSISVNILTAGTTPYTYSLNGGAAISSSNFTALAAGSYTIITTDFTGCADTLITNVAPSNNTLLPSINPTDVTCFGFNDGSATTVVNGGTPAYSYSWSTGSVNSAIQNLTAGNYGVTITDQNNCTVTAATFINQPQALVINIGNDTIVCEGHLVVIDAGNGFASYVWSNSSTTQTITTQTNGFYQVTVTDNSGCTAADGLNVNSNSANAVELGNDIVIYSGESIGLTALVASPTGGAFLWSPLDFLSCLDCQSTMASPFVNTVFVVTYTDGLGCVTKDSVNVEVIQIGDVFFPTAFSPNGDGNNDIYRVAGSSVKQFYLGIFNRWGEKVFESNNFLDGWDGVYQSVNQPMGVYVYTATVVLLNNQTRDYKGSITLIR